MFKNFFPNKILSLTNKTINKLIFLFLIFLSIGIIYSLFLSPPDYIQGDAARIMYVHVPTSILALVCFGLIGIAGINGSSEKTSSRISAMKLGKSLEASIFLAST